MSEEPQGTPFEVDDSTGGKEVDVTLLPEPEDFEAGMIDPNDVYVEGVDEGLRPSAPDADETEAPH